MYFCLGSHPVDDVNTVWLIQRCLHCNHVTLHADQVIILLLLRCIQNTMFNVRVILRTELCMKRFWTTFWRRLQSHHCNAEQFTQPLNSSLVWLGFWPFVVFLQLLWPFVTGSDKWQWDHVAGESPVLSCYCRDHYQLSETLSLIKT